MRALQGAAVIKDYFFYLADDQITQGRLKMLNCQLIQQNRSALFNRRINKAALV